MISDDLRSLLGHSRSVTTLLWLALTASIFIYVVVAWIQTGDRGGPALGEALGPMPVVLGLVALSDAALSVYLHMIWLAPARLAKRLPDDPSPEEIATNRETGQVDHGRAERIRALDPQERPLAALPSKVFTPYLLSWALNESVAVFGLVLAFTTGVFYFIVPFAIVAVLLNLVMFPRVDALAERVKRAM